MNLVHRFRSLSGNVSAKKVDLAAAIKRFVGSLREKFFYFRRELIFLFSSVYTNYRLYARKKDAIHQRHCKIQNGEIITYYVLKNHEF